MSKRNSKNNKTNDFSKYNKIFRDDAAEYVSSFEEARAIIVSRLNNLQVDLYARVPGEDALANEIAKAHEDMTNSLLDIYASNFSPCKVTDTEYIPRGQADMNDIMIDFSQGFNAFIESLEEKYVEMTVTRRQATLLLKRMLSLKLPFAQLLYYTYYKRLHPEEIKDKLYISRATFYRKKSDAINALTHLCFPNL